MELQFLKARRERPVYGAFPEPLPRHGAKYGSGIWRRYALESLYEYLRRLGCPRAMRDAHPGTLIVVIMGDENGGWCLESQLPDGHLAFARFSVLESDWDGLKAALEEVPPGRKWKPASMRATLDSDRGLI